MGEALPENLVGKCGPIPKTLTLFMTKNVDFASTLFMTVATDTDAKTNF